MKMKAPTISRNVMRALLATALLAGPLGAGLTACTASNDAAIRATQKASFDNYTPLMLPVSRVDVIKPGVKPGNQTGYGVLPVAIDEMGERYAERRFQAAGGTPVLSVVIVDTRFSETALQNGTSSGLDMLTMQRQKTVSIGMTLRLDLVDGTRRTARQEFQLDRKITFGENISLAERDLKLLRFEEGFMADIDKMVVQKLDDLIPGVSVVSNGSTVPATPPVSGLGY